MHSSYLCIFVFFLLFFYLFNSVEISYTYGASRYYGVYSQKYIAETQLGVTHTNFYVCGVRLLESRWTKNMNNCNCGRRWCGWRLWCHRCSWCENQFWTTVGGVSVKYCHKDNWADQRTKEFRTGASSTRNWRDAMCPFGQYATGIALEFGFEHEIDTGMNGIQLRCQSINFATTSIVQTLYGGSLTPMSPSPANSLITGFHFVYAPNDKLSGIKVFFGQQLKAKPNYYSYMNLQQSEAKRVTEIQILEVRNQQETAKNFTMQPIKNISMVNSFTPEFVGMNGMKFAEGSHVPPPISLSTFQSIVMVKLYKVILPEFKFKDIQVVNIAPIAAYNAEVPGCSVRRDTAIIERQKYRGAYTLIVSFESKSNNEILNRLMKGNFEGQVVNPVTIKSNVTEIPGCKDKFFKTVGVSIKYDYSKMEIVSGPTNFTVQSFEKNNFGVSNADFSSRFMTDYSVPSTWKTNQSITVPPGTIIKRPVLNNTPQDSFGQYYTLKDSPFLFNTALNSTFTPIQTTNRNSTLNWCESYKRYSQIRQLQVKIPFNITVNLKNQVTGEVKVQKSLGTFEGYAYNPIQVFQTKAQISGCKSQFLKPIAVSIEYTKIDLIGELKTIKVEQFSIQNLDFASRKITKLFNNTYSVTNTYKNDNPDFNNIEIPARSIISPPLLPGTKLVSDNNFKPSSTPFKFNTVQNTTYASVDNVNPLALQWCEVVNGLAVVNEQRVNATYTLTLTVLNTQKNQTILQKITGKFEGYALNPVNSDSKKEPIPGCRD